VNRLGRDRVKGDFGGGGEQLQRDATVAQAWTHLQVITRLAHGNIGRACLDLSGLSELNEGHVDDLLLTGDFIDFAALDDISTLRPILGTSIQSPISDGKMPDALLYVAEESDVPTVVDALAALAETMKDHR
jgi:hypothetical protein